MTHRIAIDIGAESGRVVLGRDGRDDLIELHRFANGPVDLGGTMRWDLPRLLAEIRRGLRLAAERAPDAASIGIDTWGVDYALIDRDGNLLEPAWCHRDRRTDGVLAEVDALIPQAERFARTGVAALPFNTLYQLVAHRRRNPGLLARAHRLVTVPDWLLGQLSGVYGCEHSNAGTTELLAAGRRAWDHDLIARLDLPAHLFPAIHASGTPLGPLLGAADLGFARPPLIIAPACHDTASAAACVPDAGVDGAYLSSGTWSLVGVVLDRPSLGPAAAAAGLSNEVAADGRPRLNRNIMGLWVVQRLRAAFAAQGRTYDYPTLTALAAAAPAGATVDVDDPRFLPADGKPMDERVRGWLREHGQPVPADDGGVVRAVLAGLAHAYARAVRDLEQHAGRPLRRLTIVGGGGRNRLLTDLTAAACGIPVATGPAEATALGNLRIQAGARR
ncbi:MAG: rhamnulokinase [Planctomycetota bacterium]|jgi:rhamnulokinase